MKGAETVPLSTKICLEYNEMVRGRFSVTSLAIEPTVSHNRLASSLSLSVTLIDIQFFRYSVLASH